MARLVKLTMMPIESGRGSPGIIGTEVAVPVQAKERFTRVTLGCCDFVYFARKPMSGQC